MNMKYSLLFLKYLVVITLVIIVLTGFTLGIGLIIVGLFDICFTGNSKSLILLLIGLFAIFCGCVALDCSVYLSAKWEFKY